MKKGDHFHLLLHLTQTTIPIPVTPPSELGIVRPLLLISSAPDTLAHYRYLDLMPAPDQLRTPLQFTPEELELFRGSNLYGATVDREQEWKAEWNQIREVVALSRPEWAEAYTWFAFHDKNPPPSSAKF